MSNILLISGSPSLSSRSAAILDYIRVRLAGKGFEAKIISVRDFPAEDLLFGKYDSPAFDEIKKLVAEAGGIVVSTPIYKASYAGALKALLDILPQSALRGKTVLPIATGGSPAHLLAIDYALKPVLSVLGATDLLQGVYVIDKQVAIDSEGRLVFGDEEVRERLHGAVDQLVENPRFATLSV